MDTAERVQEATSLIRWKTCCLCIPIRLGVLLVSICVVLATAYYLYNPTTHPCRHWLGGYTSLTQLIVGLTQGSGLFFGLVGAVGAYRNKKDFVTAFLMWQLAVLASQIFVFYKDVVALMPCETWVNDIADMTQGGKWNQIMFDIAMSAKCPSERQDYFVLSTLFKLLFLYVVYFTSSYLDSLNSVPKHLLSIHKDPAPGVFYADSRAAPNALIKPPVQQMHGYGGMVGGVPGAMGPMVGPGYGSMPGPFV